MVAVVLQVKHQIQILVEQVVLVVAEMVLLFQMIQVIMAKKLERRILEVVLAVLVQIELQVLAAKGS